MKINIKYAALSLLAVAGITMTSCSDDESYDVYGNPKTSSTSRPMLTIPLQVQWLIHR